MKHTLTIFDDHRAHVYEALVDGLTILRLTRFHLDSPGQTVVHFYDLPDEVQEVILTKIQENADNE